MMIPSVARVVSNEPRARLLSRDPVTVGLAAGITGTVAHWLWGLSWNGIVATMGGMTVPWVSLFMYAAYTWLFIRKLLRVSTGLPGSWTKCSWALPRRCAR